MKAERIGNVLMEVLVIVAEIVGSIVVVILWGAIVGRYLLNRHRNPPGSDPCFLGTKRVKASKNRCDGVKRP